MTFISRRDLLKRAARRRRGARRRPADRSAKRFSRASEARRRDGSAEGLALHDTSRHEMAAGARAAREPDGDRGGSARGDRRAADSERRQRRRARPRRARRTTSTARSAARSPRRGQAYTAGLAALDRYSRSSRGKAFTELSADRSGFGAHRRRDRRGDRVHRQLRAVLRARAEPHPPGHVRRSVLRRQRELHRLGSDRLSRASARW